MIVNENGWGDNVVKPIETDKDKLKKAKIVKEAPAEAEVKEDAKQE